MLQHVTRCDALTQERQEQDGYIKQQNIFTGHLKFKFYFRRILTRSVDGGKPTQTQRPFCTELDARLLKKCALNALHTDHIIR